MAQSWIRWPLDLQSLHWVQVLLLGLVVMRQWQLGRMLIRGWGREWGREVGRGRVEGEDLQLVQVMLLELVVQQ